MKQGDTQQERAAQEARMLLWVFKSEEKVKDHIHHNLERTKHVSDEDSYDFWQEVERNFTAIINKETSALEELVYLIKFVDTLEPRDKWVHPITEGEPYKKFEEQLKGVMEKFGKA
ncbi:MAG: hypothetical protein GC137_00235 [Alphaproteobacteria bacterium]|nr:hypothetical protein [Alphaproteobacteria bacterium]